MWDGRGTKSWIFGALCLIAIVVCVWGAQTLRAPVLPVNSPVLPVSSPALPANTSPALPVNPKPAVGLSGSLQLAGGGGHEKIDLSLQGDSTLNIHINSTRSRCGMNEAGGPSEACVFRVYLTSESFRSGGYCHAIKFSNGSYQCSLGVIENRFNVLLLLESFANNSNFGLLDNPDGAVVFDGARQSMGEPVLEQEVQFGTKRVLFPLPKPQKSCSFQEANVNGNDFIWVSKSVVEEAGLTAADAIIAPTDKERMPLKQDYVWFPRGCRQPWISQEDLEEAGKAAGGIDIAFVGTSRLRYSLDAVNSTLTNLTDVELIHATTHVWAPANVMSELPKLLAQEPSWSTMCPNNNNTPNERLLVMVISDGIWAVRGHEQNGMFRYHENFLARMELFREKCRFRRVKIVLATQPQLHGWDCRVTRNNAMFPKQGALHGPRMEVVNWAIRKVAREESLPLVDLGGASDARRDATCDNRHYDHPPTKVSKGVTLTFGQLALAAVLETLKK